MTTIIQKDNIEVVVTDVDVPIWSLMVLMVKIAIAAVPAAFIIAVGYMIIAALLLSGSVP